MISKTNCSYRSWLTGMVADMVRAGQPGSTVAAVLLASDGNHSGPASAFLSALVLFATITGQSPLDLPALPRYPVSVSVPPRMRRPGDLI